MPQVHFLNVNDGDCSVIQHYSEHVTVIDVCNAFATVPLVMAPRARSLLAPPPTLATDFRQKDFPVNPIEYLKTHKLTEVFRFILTHPDMDHMDGIKEFFKQFAPTNFWDTDNNKTIDWKKSASSKYDEKDWNFYTSLRAGAIADAKRLTLYSGAKSKYYNVGEDGSAGGDGLFILSPTTSLVEKANSQGKDYHACSYVILYRTDKYRILFGGDSHDDTWEYILANHEEDVTDVDVLVAPHHGRASDRSYDFLDVVNPALTLFGNAPAEHLAYGAFSSRDLPIITNNQAGCVLLDTDKTTISVFVTNKAFAQQRAAAYTFPSPLHAGYHYLQSVQRVTKLKPPPRY